MRGGQDMSEHSMGKRKRERYKSEGQERTDVGCFQVRPHVDIAAALSRVEQENHT